MGPEATGRCFDSIVNNTEAQKDQDHVPVLVYSNPRIPDRTKYIIDEGENPVPFLKKTAKKLENAGAEILLMPCNTAHYFLDELKLYVNVDFLDMIKEAISSIPAGSTVGLLATDGTIKTGIYHKYAEENDIKLITPERKGQEIVMNAIYGIKAGNKDKSVKNDLVKVANKLQEQGAKWVIAGCTEIRIALKPSDLEEVELVRPIDEVSRKAIELAGGKVK